MWFYFNKSVFSLIFLFWYVGMCKLSFSSRNTFTLPQRSECGVAGGRGCVGVGWRFWWRGRNTVQPNEGNDAHMSTVIIQVCIEKSYCQSNLCLFVSQSYGSDGLKLVVFEESVSFGQSVLKLTFDPGSPEAGLLTAECRLDHPFFVKNKGRWRSPFLCIIVKRSVWF